MKNFLFTSESVSEGHPDKVCDQISDAVLDVALSQDKDSRVAAETMICPKGVIVSGEVTTSATLDVEKIAKSTLNRKRCGPFCSFKIIYICNTARITCCRIVN